MESILIVDDNDNFREILARGLARRGYKVFAAAGYEEAMEMIGRHRPSLAVIDLKMPGRSGLELIREGLRLAPELRIVVLSGYGSIATATEAIRLGAVSYLGKPADINEILQAFHPDTHASDRQYDFSPPTLSRVEWEHIQRVLHECNGNISAAAKKLDIHRRTLQRKLNRYAPPEKKS